MKEYYYLVGNILVQVRHIFLPNYRLILSLFKSREIWVFWGKKKDFSN